MFENRLEQPRQCASKVAISLRRDEQKATANTRAPRFPAAFCLPHASFLSRSERTTLLRLTGAVGFQTRPGLHFSRSILPPRGKEAEDAEDGIESSSLRNSARVRAQPQGCSRGH